MGGVETVLVSAALNGVDVNTVVEFDACRRNDHILLLLIDPGLVGRAKSWGWCRSWRLL